MHHTSERVSSPIVFVLLLLFFLSLRGPELSFFDAPLFVHGQDLEQRDAVENAQQYITRIGGHCDGLARDHKNNTTKTHRFKAQSCTVEIVIHDHVQQWWRGGRGEGGRAWGT